MYGDIPSTQVPRDPIIIDEESRATLKAHFSLTSSYLPITNISNLVILKDHLVKEFLLVESSGVATLFVVRNFSYS